MFGQNYMGGYQPMYQQPMQDNLMQLRQPQQPGMIWVQGESGAKSYLVAAGNTVPLWDSENQCIYLKSVDASGMPSMRVLDYTERAQRAHAPVPAAMPQGEEYVTRKEFDALAAKLDALAGKGQEDG